MKIRFTGILTLFLAFMIQFSFAQERTITGTVTSAEDGLPLPGASVVIEGTTRGTRTDLDGNFSIKAMQGQKLVFSFVGSKNQVITIGTSDVINVVLSTDNIMETVEIDSYRKITPRAQSFSAKTIGGDIMEERANVSALAGLQGMVAGAYISMGSGQPGSIPNIVIRGFGSINGNTDPLYVIDGMPVEAEVFRTLSPNDIDTYTVLKDAAATSIYGNRGANGVIVIKTKSGNFNQDLKIQYVGQSGYTKMQNLNIEIMNSSQLLNMQKQYGQGLGNRLEQWEIDQLAANTNTNWRDVFFRTGISEQHDLSLSSGSENTANFTAISYTGQEGIVLRSSLKRFNIRNNFSGKSKDGKFNYSFNTGVTYVKSQDLLNVGSSFINANPFFSALLAAPYISPYDPDGSITLYGPYADAPPEDVWASIPILMLNRMQMDKYDTNDLRILSGFSANYEVLKNLTAGMRLNADYLNRSRHIINHPRTINALYALSQNGRMYGGSHQEDTRKDFYFNALYSLGYANTFNNKHTMSVSAFLEYNKSHRHIIDFFQPGIDPKFIGVAAGFIPGTTIDPVNTNQRFYVPQVGLTTLREGMLSYFATGSYDFDQKYAISTTIRRDGSFRFTEDNRWGTFWAVGAAWNIDKEKFMENVGFSYLKLRGSIGTNGNQRVTSNAPFTGLALTRNLYSTTTGYNATTGVAPSQIGNTDLIWETTEQINVGLDFGLIKGGKLQASVDVYQKTTKDLYSSIPISLVNATGSINGNVGIMENKGAELDLTYTIVNNKDWKVLASVNGSYNENKIKKLHESFDGIITSVGNTALGEGHSVGEYYVTRYIGVNPSNGHALFLDANGNPTERMNDESRVFIGKSYIPKWQGGFATSVSYKGFEFNTQWTFVADVYLSNVDYANLEDGDLSYLNKTTALLNAWQNPGDITPIPLLGSNYNYVDYINGSDRYIEDVSYLRLKNVSFAYQFSKEQIQKMPFTGLRFFTQVENLLTFSKYRGWDAEHAFRNFENLQYPTPIIYTLGMIVNF